MAVTVASTTDSVRKIQRRSLEMVSQVSQSGSAAWTGFGRLDNREGSTANSPIRRASDLSQTTTGELPTHIANDLSRGRDNGAVYERRAGVIVSPALPDPQGLHRLRLSSSSSIVTPRLFTREIARVPSGARPPLAPGSTNRSRRNNFQTSEAGLGPEHRGPGSPRRVFNQVYAGPGGQTWAGRQPRKRPSKAPSHQ